MDSRQRTDAPRRAPRPGGLLAAVGSLLATVLKLGAVVLGFVLMLGALLVGAALALGLVGWALLRGRRPQAQVFSSTFQRMRRGQAPGAGASRRHAPGDRAANGAANAAVIDIEAREVPDDGRPTAPLRTER